MYPLQIPEQPDLGFLGGMSGGEPEDFRQYGVPTFGAYADRMGIINNGLGLAAEVDYEVIDGRVACRTPMLELAPEDYQYMQQNRVPFDGMVALGDTGAVYQYSGDLGFFSKIVSAAKGAVSKVTGGIKNIIKKIPGGKYLVKLGEKIYSIANKLLAPLTHYVGKYATKLAPIAAFIPGYGPAIAGALLAAGKVAQLMQKYGVKYKGKKGKVRKLKFKSGSKAKKFKSAVKKTAKKQKKKFSSKRKELGLSKKAYAARVQGKIKTKIAGKKSLLGDDGDPMVDEFLSGAPWWQKRQRRIQRRRRVRAGLPVIPREILVRRGLLGDDFDFVDGADDGFIDGPPFWMRGGPQKWRRRFTGARRVKNKRARRMGLPPWMRR